MPEINKLRKLFLKYLTVDSKTHDARRKEFNQAIFIDPKAKYFGGKQVFNGTDLDMVMEKFDKASRRQKMDNFKLISDEEIKTTLEAKAGTDSERFRYIAQAQLDSCEEQHLERLRAIKRELEMNSFRISGNPKMRSMRFLESVWQSFWKELGV